MCLMQCFRMESIMATARTAQQRNAVQNRRRTTERATGRSQVYVQGTAARKLDVSYDPGAEQRKQLSHTTRKNRDKAIYMNLGYVLFLSVMMLIAGVVLISYIQVQSEMTTNMRTIASLESELNSLKMENDEKLNRIETSIDLNEIKRIAINELGMTYAREGQIVLIPNEGNDYVRQTGDIHK